MPGLIRKTVGLMVPAIENPRVSIFRMLPHNVFASKQYCILIAIVQNPDSNSKISNKLLLI